MKKNKLFIITLMFIAFLVVGCGKDKLKVTFDTDGGTEVKAIEVKKGEKVTLPENPSKEGFIFDKWILGEEDFSADVKVEKDITLKATWKPVENPTHPEAGVDPETPVASNKFRVTFKLNNGTKNVIKDIENKKNVAKIADPVRSGYKFTGWFLNNKAYNFKNPVTKNITLEAKWEKLPDAPSSTKPVDTPSSSSKPVDTPSSSSKPVEPEAPVDVTSVSVNPTETTIGIGDTYQINATVAPSNATNKTLTYSSNLSHIASVDANGKVTAKARGSVTITISSHNGKTTTMKININNPLKDFKIGSVEKYNRFNISYYSPTQKSVTFKIEPVTPNPDSYTVNWTTSGKMFTSDITGNQIKITAKTYSSGETHIPITVTVTATINGVSKSRTVIIEPEISFYTKPNNFPLQDNFSSSVGNTVIAHSSALGRNYDAITSNSSIIKLDYTSERHLKITCLKPGTGNITLTSYAGQKRTYTGYTCH